MLTERHPAAAGVRDNTFGRPAAKAVAQTALRADKHESNSSSSSSTSAPAGGGEGDRKRGPVDAKMSEKAMEVLAVAMAPKVARLMNLMEERCGVWQ